MPDLKRIKEIIGVQSPIRIFLDMDGVIADFDGSVNKYPKVAELRQKLNNLLEPYPELKRLSNDGLKKELVGQQTETHLIVIKKAFKQLNESIFYLASQEGFFTNLDKMNGADQLVDGVIKLMDGQLPNILTAPITSHPKCEEEKKTWIKKHFSGKYNNFICTLKKDSVVRSENDILIDDRTKYVEMFTNAGGTAILYKNASQALNDLERILKNE